ncbi:MAG: GntR family transcriptional regulator, partial [Planctomycetota bacterium]|nr:GntR family transcriptional regulator [Planctomycetota bacterium]
MSFKRLQEQAYDHLKNMILAEEFDRDTIYSETKIAETLGISRTPIRDALQRLSHDGLIDIMPSKGFCVHKLTYGDIIEIYQMRCAIEGYCAKLLAQRRNSPEAQKTLDYLSGFVAEQRILCEENRSVRELVELDYKFHIGIIDFSMNRIFSQTYSNQMYRMRMITLEGQGRPDRRKSSLAEHTE